MSIRLSLEQKQAIRIRHVNQLQHFAVPDLDRLEAQIPQLHFADGSYLTQLIQWSTKAKAYIEAAIASGMIGEKNLINWRNALLALLESSAVYLRDVPKVVEAIKAARNQEFDIAQGHLEDADSDIRTLAEFWGLEYITICDLINYSPDGQPTWAGPFCGAFSSTDDKHPLIGITFKGTNPVNLREWRVDYARQPMQAQGGKLFNGHVSRGVYTCLFTNYSNDVPEYGIPFDHIKQYIDLRTGSLSDDHKFTVHITGHSLGASYATLCFAELLQEVNEISPNKWTLGDLYTFGSPRIAESDFAQAAKEALAKQEGSMWRIVYHNDPVPTVPPAPWPLEDPRVFVHVDSGYRLSPFPWTQPAEIPSEIGMDPGPAAPSILSIAFHIADHSPTSYIPSLLEYLLFHP